MPLIDWKRAAATGLAVLALGGLSVGGQAGTGEHSVKVKAGDTLAAIAHRHGVSTTALAQANGITNPNLIIIGQTLTIPGGAAPAAAATPRTHKVKAGENLSTIAARYGTSATAIAAANNLSNPNVVVIGTTLTIPAPAITAGAGLPAKLLAHPDRLALRPTFDQWASAYGAPADLLQAIAWIESGWQASVISSTEAVGIGQLMPATVDHMRVVIGDPTLDPYDPADNIRMSARMLAFLLQQTGGDTRMAVGAYYQGLRSVRERGFVPQTEQYVAAVLATRARFA